MIDVSELTAAYGKKSVISRLSFFISQDESPLALVGANGSGKSTLLKCLMGIHPYSGKTQIKSQGRKGSIGWLPQGFKVGLDVPVIDFIAMAQMEKDTNFLSNQTAEPEKVLSILEELEMEKLAQKTISQLSGGEWQMICLAQLAIQNADIWLLDEPTAHLDLYFKNLVFSYLWKKSSQGKCIIFSTHDIPFLPKAGGKFLLLENGAEFLENSPLNSCHLMDRLSRSKGKLTF